MATSREKQPGRREWRPRSRDKFFSWGKLSAPVIRTAQLRFRAGYLSRSKQRSTFYWFRGVHFNDFSRCLIGHHEPMLFSVEIIELLRDLPVVQTIFLKLGHFAFA